MYVLSWIFFGAFTGWIAGLIVNKRGEGCIVNTALGLVGDESDMGVITQHRL